MIALGVQCLSHRQEGEDQLENQKAKKPDDGKKLRHTGRADEASQSACVVKTGPAQRTLVLLGALTGLVLLDGVVAEDARRFKLGQRRQFVRSSEVARVFVDASLHLVGARKRVPETFSREYELRRAVGVLWTECALPLQACRLEVVLVRVTRTTECVVAVGLFVDRAVADVDFQRHVLLLESLNQQCESITSWFDVGIAHGYVTAAGGDVFVHAVHQEAAHRRIFRF